MPFIANVMTRHRYLHIKQCLQVADNRILVEGSKIAKNELPYDAFNLTLKQSGILHDKLSIDQTMVPHKELHSIHQFMKSKSIMFG